MACSPTQKILFPSSLCRAVSATSEAGAGIPKVVPIGNDQGSGANNITSPLCGAASFTISGVPENESTLPARIRGGVGGWLWVPPGAESPTTAPASQVAVPLGMAEFATSDWSVPSTEVAPYVFAGGSNVTVDTARKRLISVLSSEFGWRVAIQPFDTISNGGARAYTVDTFEYDNVLGNPPVALAGVTSGEDLYFTAIEEAPDGTLLLLYPHREGAHADFCLLKSTNGGEDWSVFHRSMLNGSIAHRPQVAGIGLHMVRSGPWVMILWEVQGTSGRRYMASRDSGLTWSEPRELDPASNASAPQVNNRPATLVGLGDGRFLHAFLLTNTSWTYLLASGDGEFLAPGGSVIKNRAIYDNSIATGMTGAVFGDRVYIFITHKDPVDQAGDSQTDVFYQETFRVAANGPFVVADSGESLWKAIQSLTRFFGVRYHSTWMSAVNAGGRHIWVGGSLVDTLDMGAARHGSFAFQFSGISPLPTGQSALSEALPIDRDNTQIYSRDPYMLLQWAVPNGEPDGVGTAAGSAPPNTLWTRQVAGGTAGIDYTTDRLRLDIGAAGLARYVINAGPGGFGVIGFACACPTGSSATVDSAGIRFQTAVQGSTTDIVRGSIRVTPASLSIVDANTGATTLIPIDTKNGVQVRVVVTTSTNSLGASTGKVFLRAWEDSDPQGTMVWNSRSLTPFANAQNDTVAFGHIGAGVAATSFWTEFFVSDSVEYATRAADLPVSTFGPDSLQLGIPEGHEILIDDCLTVTATGSPAQGDTWSVEPCFAYGVDKTLTEGSIVQWRSTDESRQDIVFEFDQISMVNGVYMSGFEVPLVLIKFSDDEAGLVNPIDVGIDSRLPFQLAVDSAVGDVLTYSVTAGPEPYAGELIGMRISQSLAGTVTTWRVVEHCGQKLRLEGIHATSALVAGTDLTVWAPYGWADFGTEICRRYMTVSMLGASVGQTPDGYHSLGAVVVGCILDFPFVLEWSSRDSETAPVQRYQGESGITWAHRMGPAQRVWTGRLVNDDTTFRHTLRKFKDHLGGYGSRPVVLITDPSDRVEGSIYGIMVDSALDNSFWCKRAELDSGDLYQTGGDERIEITEIP